MAMLRQLHLLHPDQGEAGLAPAGIPRQSGQGMVEYALIIALIAIVLVAALTAFGGGLQRLFNSIANTVNAS